MLKSVGGMSVLAVLASLAAVSLLPPGSLVRSGVLPGQAEHVIAYMVSTLVIVIALCDRARPRQVVLFMMSYACVLELGQLAVPGRHAAFGDALASVTGVLLGLAAGAVVLLHRGRIQPRLSS